jgi:hypothetical protein
VEHHVEVVDVVGKDLVASARHEQHLDRNTRVAVEFLGKLH